MNWDAIGAIGEILGAGAVFASLIYLAVQIKSSSKIATGESEREVWSKWIETVHGLLSTPQAARINSAGFSDLEELTPEERLMFSGDLGKVVNTHHMIWRMHKSGLAGGDLVLFCDQVLVNLISSPGGRRWWETARSWYAAQPNYQTYIDTKLAEGAAYPMEDFLDTMGTAQS